MLKRLVKQRKQRVSKTGRILRENGRPEIFTKNRRFLPGNLCWSALGVAQGETSADLRWFSYHSCTGVALTSSKVLVTCVITYRTDLCDNTCGLRTYQCTVATEYMHPRGCVLWISSDRDDQRNFRVWNFHFQVFWGYKNLAIIYLGGLI